MQETPEARAARLVTGQREYYDLRAPDYADVSRPADRKHRGVMSSAQARDILDALNIGGDVLEVACGSGGFTKELVHLASSLVALDSSPAMLDINRTIVGDAGVEYVCADAFEWRPARQFDFVFFGFWLSHVPPTHFAAFWDVVREALRPGGRCGFVDEDHRGRANEAATSDDGVPAATRTLSDGRSFEIVKVFWHPQELHQQLASHGWRSTVWSFGDTFLAGEATLDDGMARRPNEL